MAAGDTLQGRRRDDVVWGTGDHPSHAQPGDYWRYVNADGAPLDCGDDAHARGNLTRGVWGCVGPCGNNGLLKLHTVREEDDGTISVRPGDGSSNSILLAHSQWNEQTEAWDQVTTWHGYIERGVWREV